MARKISSTLALAALVAAIALTIANRMHVRLATRASHVVLASYTGEHLTSFFAGLHPVPAYINGKLYPNGSSSAKRSRCGKQPSLLSRVAVSIGLERVAYAQGACGSQGCQGCYTKIVTALCSAEDCSGGTYTQEASGGQCTGGFELDGPACGTSGSCGCNVVACTQSAAHCGC